MQCQNKENMLKIVLGIFVSSLLFTSYAQQNNSLVWPREIEKSNYLVTLYQPQLESLDQILLKGRIALSVEDTVSKEITFGSMWFDATLATDLQERTAILDDLEVRRMIFPDAEDTSNYDYLQDLIIKDFLNDDITMSLDHIISSLENSAQVQQIDEKILNDPPKIYYRTKPTVLVSIDGPPIVEPTDNDKLTYIVNSPFFIAIKNDLFYLKGGDYWYSSTELLGENFVQTKKVPSDVKKLASQKIQEENSSMDKKDEKIPALLVVDQPSELITTDGKASYKPVQGTRLLFVDNSENDILLEIESQQHFLLLNGRWFTNSTLQEEDWVFRDPNDLPEEFSMIPDTSAMASVRSSIPGTREAQESLLEQQIPQTAVIDRKTARVEVKYDGEPRFKQIEGTDLYYAENSNVTVIREKKKYYAIDSAIWFVSINPFGPWEVSEERPNQVEKIPPSSPVHNVKYVYIYSSTPEVIYVGYTPGYYHSYIYHGCLFYGTGFYYRPWYGSIYYPRPVTFGYGVHYNPWTGWGFSVGMSYGWFTVSTYRGYGYWGPAGYRHGYRHGYYNGYHHGYRHGYNKGYAAGYAHGRHQSTNLYKSRATGVRSTGNYKRPSTANRNPQIRPSTRPNNIYSDKKGNIHQRDNKGNWNQIQNRPSKPHSPTTRPSTKPSTKPTTRPSTRPSTKPTPSKTRPQLEHSYQGRTRGNQNYNRQQSMPRPSPRPAAPKGRPGRR